MRANSAASRCCLLYTSYLNHLEQADLQLTREPLPAPQLLLRRRPPSIFEFEFEDFEFMNYQFHPAIRAPVAV